MFENLTNKFEEIFSSLKKAPSLNEAQVDEGLRKIRQALLEADVALPVAKELIKNIKPKAIGQEIIKSTTPGQMIVKVVFDEVVKILGDSKSEFYDVPVARHTLNLQSRDIDFHGRYAAQGYLVRRLEGVDRYIAFIVFFIKSVIFKRNKYMKYFMRGFRS